MVLYRQALNHVFRVLAARVHFVYTVNIQRGNMNSLGVKPTGLYDLFDLSDDTPRSCCHICIKIASRLVKLKISQCVCPLRFN
jgi:hypothetical protein